jgi:Ca2+-binding EF-hand superfamily protein
MKNLGLVAMILMSGVVLAASGCAANTSESPNDATAAASADSQSESADQSLEKDRHHARAAALFAEADKNTDGKVTLEEAQAAGALRFAKADANNDGQLDATERQALRPEPGMRPPKDKAGWRGERADHDEARQPGEHAGRGERGEGRGPARFDKDGDGAISRAEAPPMLLEHFAQADKNGDGLIDKDEMAALRAARHDEAGKGGDDHRGPGKGGMARWDANGDGMLTAAEFSTGIAEQFKRMDADGDGAITLAEIQANRPKHDPR